MYVCISKYTHIANPFTHICSLWSLLCIPSSISQTHGVCLETHHSGGQGKRIMSLRPVWSSLDDVSLGFTVRCCLKKSQRGKKPSARQNEWLTYLSDLAAPPSVTFLMKMPYLRCPVLWGLRVMSAGPWQSAEVSCKASGYRKSPSPPQTGWRMLLFKPCSSLQPFGLRCDSSLSTVLSPVTSPNSHSGHWKDNRATGSFLNFNLSGTMEQESLDINSGSNRFPRCLKQLLLISAPARCLPITSQLGCFKKIMAL